MVISITQHKKRDLHKTSKRGFNKDFHVELHITTTVWFFFIPIWRYKRLLKDNL